MEWSLEDEMKKGIGEKTVKEEKGSKLRRRLWAWAEDDGKGRTFRKSGSQPLSV